jgi:hypothetical protein
MPSPLSAAAGAGKLAKVQHLIAIHEFAEVSLSLNDHDDGFDQYVFISFICSNAFKQQELFRVDSKDTCVVPWIQSTCIFVHIDQHVFISFICLTGREGTCNAACLCKGLPACCPMAAGEV